MYAAHATLGADPPRSAPRRRLGEVTVNQSDLLVGGARGLVSGMVGHEREVQLGLGVHPELT